MKVIGSYLGRSGRYAQGKKKSEQPIQQCMAERPEVSRGRSTVKGNDPVVRGGCTSGAGRAEQRKSYEREEC